MQNPYSWLKTKLTQKRSNGKTYNSTNDQPLGETNNNTPNQPIGAPDSSFSLDNLYGQVINAINDETQFLNNTTNKPIPADVSINSSINSSIDSVFDNDLFHNTNPNNDRNRRKQQTTTNSQDNSNKNNQSSMNAVFDALKDNMNSFWEDMSSLDLTVGNIFTPKDRLNHLIYNLKPITPKDRLNHLIYNLKPITPKDRLNRLITNMEQFGSKKYNNDNINLGRTKKNQNTQNKNDQKYTSSPTTSL